MPTRLLAVGLAVVALAVGCTDSSDEADDRGSRPPVEFPTPTPVPVGVPVQTFELGAGRCFNQYELVDEATGDTTRLTTEVNCSSPHDGEIYAELVHPAPGGEPFPGQLELDRWAQASCYDEFEAFVGTPYELSRLEIGTFRPSAQQWNEGSYRSVHCWVSLPDEPLDSSVRGEGL